MDRARLASTALAALLAAGCFPPGPRPSSTQASNALPEGDPSAYGTTLAQAKPLAETQQLVVRMGRDSAGYPVVLSVVSPALTPEQQEEVKRAFGLGEWKRPVPVATQADTWLETIQRNK